MVSFEGYHEWIEDIECFRKLSNVVQNHSKVVRKWFQSDLKVTPTKFTIDHFRLWITFDHHRQPSITFDKKSIDSRRMTSTPFWAILWKVNTLDATSMSLSHLRRFHPSTTFDNLWRSGTQLVQRVLKVDNFNQLGLYRQLKPIN